MSQKLHSTNKSIIERGPTKNPELRARLHRLKVGECIITNSPDAQRLAASLSRTTKIHSGTKYITRNVPGGLEIQLVPHHERSNQLTLPLPEAKVEILPPPQVPVKMQLDESDVTELNALRDLFNGFMQRLELKAK